MFIFQATDIDNDFNSKIFVVDEFAKRWWYALPEWPPKDTDYNTLLK